MRRYVRGVCPHCRSASGIPDIGPVPRCGRCGKDLCQLCRAPTLAPGWFQPKRPSTCDREERGESARLAWELRHKREGMISSVRELDLGGG